MNPINILEDEISQAKREFEKDARDNTKSTKHLDELEFGIRVLEDQLVFVKRLIDFSLPYRYCQAHFSDFEKENCKLITPVFKGNVLSFTGSDVNVASKMALCVNDFGKTFYNIIVYGPVGSGKTHLSASFLIELYFEYFSKKRHENHPCKFLFMSAHDILAAFMNHSFEKEKDIEAIRNADLLIIDDLGTESGSLPPWAVDQFLHRVLKYRYHNRLNTIITTNLMPDKLSEIYGERIRSIFFGQENVHLILNREDRRKQ